MIIYKVTNKINGKVYIGKTKRSIETRWKQHVHDARGKHRCGKLQKAILEHGEKNFIVEQIDCAATNDEANDKEIYWIAFYNSTETGYNTSAGGRNSGANKKVVNVETGQVYNGLVEAAKAVGRSPGSIHQAIKNPTWKSGGFHWKFANNQESFQ